MLKQNSSAAPEEIIDQTLEDVQRHADGANQSDDITVMCIKYCCMEKSIILANEISEISKLNDFIENIGVTVPRQ